MCPHVTHASFGPPESITQTASRISHFTQLTAECRACWSMPFPSKLFLPMGDLDTQPIRGSLGPPDLTSHKASRSVQPFYWARGRASLYFIMTRPSPCKKLSLPMEMWTHTAWFLEPPEPTTQTASRSAQPFCRAHNSDRQRDRQTTLFGL